MEKLSNLIEFTSGSPQFRITESTNERAPTYHLYSQTEVLNKVSYGNEVALTKNGVAKYAIIDIEELERMRAERWLMSELRKSETSITAGRTYSEEDMRKEFGI
jgi:prevent-host-death family protein